METQLLAAPAPSYRTALLLSVFTLLYNLFEGIVSTLWGLQDESLSLFGFGLDSFIEVISALGILYMLLRIQRNSHSQIAPFEVTALRVTGFCFYALAAGLTLMAVGNIYYGHRPEATLSGIVVSVISIVVMLLLVRAKTGVGRELGSEPILADANCTRVCIYMSLVLLAASLIYTLSGIGYVDSLGTLGLVYFSVREGRESFEKAHGKACSCES